jgi:DNA ligase-1
MVLFKRLFYLFLALFMAFPLTAEILPVQLVSVYQSNIQVADYLVSEKYDGVRAIWKEGKLLTKKGNKIYAPDWFINALPDVWLDGELWSKRQDFEFIASTVLSKKANTAAWKRIKYKVFDMPNYQLPFIDRAEAYTQLLTQLNVPFIQAIKQFQLKSNDELSRMLKNFTERGSEGLILHRKQARFASGRSDNVLKLKPYQESQAKVRAYVPGKGKYQGMTGALEVVWVSNKQAMPIRFKIGSGLSDQDRQQPPKIGSMVRFKYHGVTKNNIPRFASYIDLLPPE